MSQRPDVLALLPLSAFVTGFSPTVPGTLAGDCAYVWPAGFGEGNMRVVNIQVDDTAASRV